MPILMPALAGAFASPVSSADRVRSGWLLKDTWDRGQVHQPAPDAV